ncbi:MAG: protein phosphatase CheZ [Herminiimonas sp.]|nr:protein phosphatase CheZ [Herminiimonas sp.]
MNATADVLAIELGFPIDEAGKLPVFDRLGIIVRALHDTLNEIGAQAVIADAASEFPSARERLMHIADLTEKAANIVLCKVEESAPLMDRLASEAHALERAWDRPAADNADQSALVGDTRQFLAEVQSGCGVTRGALSAMMMAQDFQDLTGQLIKKVVALMERTEKDLLKLLIDAAPPGAAVHEHKEELMAGPGAPGSTALDQESVDDLLADLGF